MQSRPTGERPAQLDLEEKFRPLLQDILSHAHRSRETPLRFGIDSDGIINAALSDFHLAQTDREIESLPNWETVKAVFNVLVKRTLIAAEESGGGEYRSRCGEPTPPASQNGAVIPAGSGARGPKNAPHPLAVWLERFYNQMRSVHPQAIEIVRMRMEDFSGREIAEQLGLGLHLVKRIMKDMRSTLETEVGS